MALNTKGLLTPVHCNVRVSLFLKVCSLLFSFCYVCRCFLFMRTDVFPLFREKSKRQVQKVTADAPTPSEHARKFRSAWWGKFCLFVSLSSYLDVSVPVYVKNTGQPGEETFSHQFYTVQETIVLFLGPKINATESVLKFWVIVWKGRAPLVNSKTCTSQWEYDGLPELRIPRAVP